MINIKNIEVGYRDTRVLDSVSIDFMPNEFTFILGPNGAGKSTLLKSINGILKPNHGEILVDNKPIEQYEEKELARQIAFIPQEFYMQFDFTVYEIVLMARYPWLSFWGQYRDEDHAKAEKYIKYLGLDSFKDRFFNRLSGGEKQRVLIARVLTQETHYILMDESLSYLDINHQIEILRLLKDINEKDNKAIIMISHNINLAAEFGKRLIFVKKGKIICEGSPADIYTEETISQIFDMDVKMIVNPHTGVRNLVYSS